MEASKVDTDDNKKLCHKCFNTKSIPGISALYEDMVNRALPMYGPGEIPTGVVFTVYEQFDAQFVKVVRDRKYNSDEESAAFLDALEVEN